MARIPTRKIALTNAKIVAAIEGLNVISGGRFITLDGKNYPRAFIFDGKAGGDVRYALARIASILKPLVETFKAANDQVFRDHEPVTEEDKDGKEQLAIAVSRQLDYQKAVADLFARETEPVEFPLISYEAMKVGDDKGQNPIQPNAISALEPFLVWTQEEWDALSKAAGEKTQPAPSNESED